MSTTCTSYKHARAKVEEENAVYGELGSGINSSNTPQKSSNKSRKRKAVDTADGSDDNEVVNGPTGKTRTFTAANQNKAKKRPRGTGTEERSHGRADSEATEPGHGIVKKEDESDGKHLHSFVSISCHVIDNNRACAVE